MNKLIEAGDKVNDKFTFVIISIVAIAIWTLGALETTAGKLFFGLLVLSVILIVLFNLLIKTEKIELPFRDNDNLSIFFFWGGIILISLLNIGQLKSFSVIKPFILSTGAENVSKLTVFTTASLETNPFINWFATVWGAGVLEPFVFRVGAYLFGAVLGLLIISLLYKSSSDKIKRLWAMGFGIIASIITFIIAHNFNESYRNNTQLFVFAGVFSIIILLGIYYLNGGLALAMGIHMSNNFYALGVKNSFDAITFGLGAGGLISLLTWIILIFLGVTFIVFIANIPKIPSMLKNIIKSVGL